MKMLIILWTDQIEALKAREVVLVASYRIKTVLLVEHKVQVGINQLANLKNK